MLLIPMLFDVSLNPKKVKSKSPKNIRNWCAIWLVGCQHNMIFLNTACHHAPFTHLQRKIRGTCIGKIKSKYWATPDPTTPNQPHELKQVREQAQQNQNWRAKRSSIWQQFNIWALISYQPIRFRM